MRDATRAEIVYAVLGPGEQTRGRRRLVITGARPELVRNAAGEPAGVGVHVELWDGDIPVDVDPHRVIVNPPLQVVEAPEERDDAGQITAPRTVRRAPAEAFWDALWASVETYPSPETIAPRRRRR